MEYPLPRFSGGKLLTLHAGRSEVPNAKGAGCDWWDLGAVGPGRVEEKGGLGAQSPGRAAAIGMPLPHGFGTRTRSSPWRDTEVSAEALGPALRSPPSSLKGASMHFFPPCLL